MWLKVGVGVALLWWFTRPAGAALPQIFGKACPEGTVSGPWFTCVPTSSPGVGVTVIKTSSECDPSSPIYDPKRCIAQAGVTSVPDYCNPKSPDYDAYNCVML